LALVPATDHYATGRMIGIALGSSNPHGDHEDLRAKGVDVDDGLTGGEGGVPLLFFFRDVDVNQLMVVEDR
jgi:hypothetical protein